MFALEIQLVNDHEKSIIKLHPANFVLNWIDDERFNFFLYIICEDGEIADEISELTMQDEKFERYFHGQRKCEYEQGLSKKKDTVVDPKRQEELDFSQIGSVKEDGEPVKVSNAQLGLPVNSKTIDLEDKK